MPLNFSDAVGRVRAGEDLRLVSQQLLSELSLDEKLWLLDGDLPFWPGLVEMTGIGYLVNSPLNFGEVKRLGIPGIRFTDGPRGICLGKSTVFPVSMARGATWDIELEERLGKAIGLEGRAQGANCFAGICINLPRHPAWGRAQETYGEDPFLLGEFGAALTRGVQSNLIGCVKHYALNSMENARFKVDVRVSDAVLHETYLPHFRRVVEEGVLSVMSSYNSVQGEWAGQNEKLLTQILRGQWNFPWFVMSDFLFGLRDPVLSLKAGLDIEAPFIQQRADPSRGLKKGLEEKKITEEHVNTAGLRILGTQLTHYVKRDQQEPSKDIVFCQDHQDLAREVAQRSMVLLKNEKLEGKAILPLSPPAVRSLALVGRLATKENTGDQGSSIVRCPKVVSPYDGLKTAFPQTHIALSDSDDIDAAIQASSSSDVAIVIVGYTAADEGEFIVPDFSNVANLFPPDDGSDAFKIMAAARAKGTTWTATEETGGDRKSIRLRQKDVDLILATASVNSRTIVCVITAGAVIMEEWRHKVPAVVISWYSGTQGGNALADVLAGLVDASGRLPYSIPKSEDDLPYFDKDTSSIEYDQWFGQRLLDHKGVDAAYPLGFGLSYTQFKAEKLECDNVVGEHIMVRLHVSNTGVRSGRHVIQIYGILEAKDRPRRTLLGFSSVELEAGSSKEVAVRASLRPMQRYDERTGAFVQPQEFRIEAASHSGDSSALISRPIKIIDTKL